MSLQILDTDTRFTDSPDSGPDCLCSRCGKPILGGMALRAWGGETEGGFEFECRYHFACQGFDPKNDEPEDDFDYDFNEWHP